MYQDRRRFLHATAGAFAALAASGCGMARSPDAATSPITSGASRGLMADPAGILDLPEGFSYRVISRLGDPMSDGLLVPDRADGMGCFDLGNGEIALVRNHELSPGNESGGILGQAYRHDSDGAPFPGGTTNLVLDAETLAVKRQFRSLSGTIRNCAGGITPWGTWLTCEEPGPSRMLSHTDHGYVFEVSASASAAVDPVPLKAMGRFNHEAACVDPTNGIVYMTEDRDDGLFYRFLPNVAGDLAKGGSLQALAMVDGRKDARNHDAVQFGLREPATVRWITLDNPEAPEDDLRKRGGDAGAVKFARGEGLHMGLTSAGRAELYFCCTSGGAAGLGQIFRLVPGANGAADTLELFFESVSKEQFDYGDNLTVAPFGDLIVCEDQYTNQNNNRLIGITPAGEAYTFGRLRMYTELAGGCFSPDGKWFFVNAYSPTLTVAITGPWVA
jgi:hypothetical protein